VTVAATFLAGARGRLLPASIPFRYFIVAALFHVGLWAALAAGADEVAGFEGGPGLPLAAVHLLTLGVLAATAMGAAVQLLPVATRQPMPAEWPARLAFWLFVPGVLVLAHGLATGAMPTLWAGGAGAVAGLALFAALMGLNLWRGGGMPIVTGHGWLSLASLAALMLLGLGLIADFAAGFLPDHGSVALAHVILACYGFMGMLALGFSHVLVPMFALSPAPPQTLGWVGLALAGAAVVIAAGGALAASSAVVAAGAAVGLAAAGLHLATMARVMATRMRKRLGLSFVLVRVAWVLLPASIVIGAAALFELAGPRGPALFGLVLVFGWLLTFVLAILQRILPFLAAMHAARGGGRAPLASEMAGAGSLRLHAGCHLAALALLAVAILLDSAPVVRAAALIGLLGAIAFAWFAIEVTRRMAVAASAPAAAKEGASG